LISIVLICMYLEIVAIIGSNNIFFAGHHTIDILQWQKGEYVDVIQHGLHIFSVVDDLVGEMNDIYEFYWMMTNPSEMNVQEFLSVNANYTFTPRPPGNNLYIPDESEVLSGDYFAITDNSLGIYAIIAYGTGSRTSHTAVALWRNDALYICESIGNPGVRCTPYKEYMTASFGFYENSTRAVSLLRLAPEYRAKFNATKADEWYQTVEGLPYGFQTFFFGWVDTAKKNYPFPLTEEFLTVFLPIIEEFAPEVTKMWLDSWNMRMGTVNLTTEEIYDLLEDRNITFGELMTMPEQDDWVYPEVKYPGKLMVCDVFVMNLYKAAGIFGDFADQFQAAEFTPKDSYQVQLFDNDLSNYPSGCPTNIGVNYCQMSGQLVQDLPDYNSIPLYPNMNEKCESEPPLYARVPANC